MTDQTHSSLPHLPAEPQLQLTVSVPQAYAIRDALDLYARLCTGKLDEVGDLVRMGIIPMSSPHDQPRVESSIDTTDKVIELLERAKNLLGFSTGASMGIGSPHVHQSGHRAWEIKKELAQTLAIHHEPNPSFRGVDYDGMILRYTDDPEPIAIIIDFHSSLPQPQPEPQLQLTVSVPQAYAIRDALDLYARLCIGKLEEVGDLVRMGIIPMSSKHDQTRVESSIDTTNKVIAVLEMAKNLLGYSTGGSMGIGSPHVHQSGHRAWEIKKELAQTLAIHNEPNPSFRGVDYQGMILRYTNDPEPVAIIVDSSPAADAAVTQSNVKAQGMSVKRRS